MIHGLLTAWLHQIVEFKAGQGFDRNQGKFIVCINVPEPTISPRYVCLFIMQAKNVELTAHVSLLRYPQEIIIYYYILLCGGGGSTS